MVKQEQLSPRSSSSQADNLSSQGSPHDSAAGRGGWLTLSFSYTVSWCWRVASASFLVLQSISVHLGKFSLISSRFCYITDLFESDSRQS